MSGLGLAFDLGTSGFRGQAIDEDGSIISTVVTTRHPLPGANVIDHLHFALEAGVDRARETVVKAMNRMIGRMQIDPTRVRRLAVCGNPIQLSIFQGMEIRDLAYAGRRKLEALGVVEPNRNARITDGRDFPDLNIPADATVIIPPAVRHEIGADALAMMIQTDMLEKDEISLVTDYGTNAEMALFSGGVVYTGSTAAGPALEGQQIEYGLLALPGAICDVEFDTATHPEPLFTNKTTQPGELKTWVLDEDMMTRPGDTIDPVSGNIVADGPLRAVGITGTGVVALLSQGLRTGLIKLPRIETLDTELHLPDDIIFTEKDLVEAGKAIGSVRAGHITLCQEAGIRLEDIDTAYMSGASGTYVDALKAQEIGMIPSGVKKIYQVGNTSLAMARDMVRDDKALENMQKIAEDLRQNHCMFASSKVFEKAYILELSFWTEGLPWEQYIGMLNRYGLPEPSPRENIPEVIKTVDRDIPDLGRKGLYIVRDIGHIRIDVFDGCTGCEACAEACPENALRIQEDDPVFMTSIDPAQCLGVACRRCERACPEKCFNLIQILTVPD